MADVHEINRIEQLGAYRAVWGALLDRTAGASFFHSLEWLETYWRHFGAGQKLRVLIVSSAGRAVGILPMVVCRERTRVGWVRTLTYPLHNWGSFYGPVTADPDTTLAAGLEHIGATPRDWDLLEFRWIDPSAGYGAATASALRTAGLDSYRTLWDRTAVIELSGTWDDYLAARPAKWRSNLRRDARRLDRQGRVEYVRYRPRGEMHGQSDPRWDLYDACEQVARRSWQGSSTTGTTLSHESIRPFLREAHAAAARRGEVDVNLLFLDGEPLAFSYNYYRSGQVYGLRAGYDASLSREGAGNLIHFSAIRDSFARGDTFYDLGIESLHCKRYFATRVLPIVRYSRFHPASPRAQLLRVKRWLQQRAILRQPLAVE